ncbi:hypothetical protein LSTR_LSTR005577 [Laodelphax striatellus]|uniref:Calcium signal-modulating cyclophilin ligand n=1 Tax=Laodelphax striatellus TaxID=195883 RepID=A0A482WY72_LAOST|nr:hypothetical protein LSTR_LSTR005577 [Laodelphax striatellus]
MSVDAVAARREARRRKILENSSNRLTKILGQSDASLTDGSGNDIPASFITRSSDPQPCNGLAFHEEPSIIPNGTNTQNNFTNFLTEELLPRTQGIGAQESASKEHSNRSDNKTWWIIFHILFGLVIRLMFEFNLGVLFADSLCMPFVTMLVAKYVSNPDLIGGAHDASGQGLIKLALMMCGIRQTALDKIFLCQSLLTKVVFDFSLYFFSFTLTHELLSIFSSR